MSRKHRSPAKKKAALPSNSMRMPLRLLALLAVSVSFIALSFVFNRNRDRSPGPSEEKPAQITGRVTFAKDIAPIVFDNCAQCHHPNGSAPFDLLTYIDVKKRAKDIGRVTAARIMPPWQPEH